MAGDFDIFIGQRTQWGGHQRPFGLNDRDAFQHVWINGQTGVGKSALLLSIFAQTVANGHGCTLVDLNGDLAGDALNYIPLSRRNDVVICDPTDTEHVLPINPFYHVPQDRRAITANDFTEAARAIWEDSWGERMDWILRNVVAAILDAPDRLRPTMLSIPLLLTNRPYQREIINHIEDVNVARFFKEEFYRWSDTKRSDFIMPIENKIGKLIANPFVRNMLSPFRPAFQFRDAIANRSILIIRLAKGTLGNEPAALLGSLAISSILNASLAQASLPYEARVPHFLFIDEQHNLKTNALATAYAEHRKYKLAIISTTQFTDQLDRQLIASMFGNIGTIIAFRSSAADADRFSRQIGEFAPNEYTQLGTGDVRVKLVKDGQVMIPFRATTVIDCLNRPDKAPQIRDYVRDRYTRPRADIEVDYRRWLRKTMLDPASRRKPTGRGQSKRSVPRADRVPAGAVSHSSGSISDRGLKARAGIRAIVDAAGDDPRQHKKPTRRRLRRSSD